MEKRLPQESRRRSALQRSRTRAYTWDSTVAPRVEIDYDKLRELCINFSPNERIDHEEFMKQYPSIFMAKESTTTLPLPLHRPHTCHVSSREYDPTAPHDVRPFMKVVHGHSRETDRKEMASITLSNRLQKILMIARKLPLQRNHQEVHDLAEQLMVTIPSLPYDDRAIAKLDFYTGLAKRGILESVPSAGYALPGIGGYYLILRGSVEKLDRAKDTGQESVTTLYPGESFGSVDQESELTRQQVKRKYPFYSSAEACMLLRINIADYHRAAETCKKSYREERLKLLNSCGLLYAVSPSIVSRLADALIMEEVQEDAVVIHQGQAIDRVWFIKEGRCTASVTVPGTKRDTEITVGELTPGDCIGEVLLLGNTETQPYTVITSTATTLGSVPISVIKATELQKHILSDRKSTLPPLAPEEIRESYVQGTMDQQWSRIKAYVIDEVTKERGIQFGIKKWQHSASQQ